MGIRAKMEMRRQPGYMGNRPHPLDEGDGPVGREN